LTYTAAGPGPPLDFCPHAVKRSDPSDEETSAPFGIRTTGKAGVGVATIAWVDPTLPSKYNAVITKAYSCPPAREASIQLGVVMSPE
jgi:hypothetical protein